MKFNEKRAFLFLKCPNDPCLTCVHPLRSVVDFRRTVRHRILFRSPTTIVHGVSKYRVDLCWYARFDHPRTLRPTMARRHGRSECPREPRCDAIHSAKVGRGSDPARTRLSFTFLSCFLSNVLLKNLKRSNSVVNHK